MGVFIVFGLSLIFAYTNAKSGEQKWDDYTLDCEIFLDNKSSILKCYVKITRDKPKRRTFRYYNN